jgi:hypothetical protein
MFANGTRAVVSSPSKAGKCFLSRFPGRPHFSECGWKTQPQPQRAKLSTPGMGAGGLRLLGTTAV